MKKASSTTILVSVATVLAACAIASVAWHATAWATYQASWTAATPAQRLQSAQRAARLEPWSTEANVRALWLRGDAELDSGDYNAAVETLAQAYRRDIGNRDLLADFRRAQRVQSLETVKKAHLQHGHEGPGGTLRPEDIER